MKRWSLRVLPVLLALGCNGLGDPIVAGPGGGESGGPFKCAAPKQECNPGFTSEAPFAPPVPVDVTRLCPAPTQACSNAQQGSGCVLSLRVVDDQPVVLPAQRCVALELAPAPASVRPTLQPLTVSGSSIRLRAEQSTTFVLSQVTLNDVAIELSGPIALELDGNLDNVSIRSASEVDVTVRGGTMPTLGLAVSLPQGQLRVERAIFGNSQLAAREITLETVNMTDVAITAERMVAIEVGGARARLDVSDLSVSEIALESLALHRCDVALLVNARLTAPRLAGCSEVLRAHSSSFTDGLAQGDIESDGTTWTQMVLGAANAPTRMQLVGGTLTSSRLCVGVQRLEVSETPSLSCVACTALARPDQVLCTTDGGRLPSGLEPPTPGALTGGNTLCPIVDRGLPYCE